MSVANKPIINCAIYTRKSSEEGLDQDFNSLDAQYEAAAAYIGSQKHEGWRLLDKRYDDGGHSGGTMERPALEQLLADIDSGLVKMVVVYKIDRLTRSLADFARLVERMDKVGCSFVSVTQSFNTSTSMGRLTLNVLLSFAQFEREVTAERIRDKIAASKAKGLWMGGYPPLGYDRHPDDKVRSLIINEDEADQIRIIFGLYEQHTNLATTQQAAAELNIRSKRHPLRDGRIRGGSLMSRGQIQSLLANPVYAGLIKHKDKTYNGLHNAIIESDRWDRVQALLQSNARKARGKIKADNRDGFNRPLRGILADANGRSLTTTYTIKNGKKYHYYVPKPDDQNAASENSDNWRLPARDIEKIVQTALRKHLEHHIKTHRLISNPTTEAVTALAVRANQLSAEMAYDLAKSAEVIGGVKIETGSLSIELDSIILAKRLKVQADDLAPSLLCFDTPFGRKRRGIETRLVAGTEPQSQIDTTLITTLQAAHRWMDCLKQGQTLTQIAQSEKRSESYVRTRIAMALLAPEIQSAILRGQQPVELTADRFARENIPNCWNEQAAKFGF